MKEELRSLELDILSRSLKINGKEAHGISEFNLIFSHGEWKLTITQDFKGKKIVPTDTDTKGEK